MELELMKKIYAKLSDDLSKEIFMYRIMASISEWDESWDTKLFRTNGKLAEFIRLVENFPGDVVVMGCGYRGKQLVRLHKAIKWKCFIDNAPKESTYENIPVRKADLFLQEYKDELVVISSKIYNLEMYQQLVENGVRKENIIDYGAILNEIRDDQYFDLEELPISEEEVFIDLGCFDAMTDVALKRKIGGKLKMVIAFEPDLRRVQCCKENLEHAGISYQLVERGGWSEECTLHFGIHDKSGLLVLGDSGEEVKVTSVDRVLGGNSASFIKMDIEGSEYEALRGCKNTILKYKPKLAISVYHKFTDIFDIPALIMEYCPDYKLYLRHYAPDSNETVLYAIPG